MWLRLPSGAFDSSVISETAALTTYDPFPRISARPPFTPPSPLPSTHGHIPIQRSGKAPSDDQLPKLGRIPIERARTCHPGQAEHDHGFPTDLV